MAGQQGKTLRSEMRDIESSYPLTAMQKSMLLHHVVERSSGVDIEQVVIRMPRDLDVEAFRAAWEQTVRRHAVLRTAFAWQQKEEPLQQVHRSVDLPLVHTNWSDVDPAEQQLRLQAFLRNDRTAGFEMDCPPLLRLNLFRLGIESHAFVWTAHHIVLDGGAFPAVMRDVAAFYEMHVGGGQVALEPTSLFSARVAWLRARDLNADEIYWREQLRGFDAPTPLGIGRSRPSTGAADRQADREMLLSAGQTKAFQALRAHLHTTPTILVLTAWALLLGRYSGLRDVVFGVTRACRRSGSTPSTDTVGLFVNTLPFRVRLHEDQTVREVVHAIQAQWSALRDYENAPHDLVRSWSSVPGDRQLFNTLVVYDNQKPEIALRSLGGIWSGSELRPYDCSGLPLALSVCGGDRLHMRLCYDRRLFDEATIDRALGHVAILLEEMAVDPLRPVGSLRLLSASEERQLTVEWCGSDHDCGAWQSLHRMFEAQAERIPDEPAVECAAQLLTYRQLNERANQLAHHLRAQGVTSETRVAICLDRSMEMIVAVLGVFKAGAAYVPLDPTYPADRIAFMLRDAAPKIAITEQALADLISAEVNTIILLDAVSPELAAAPVHNPESRTVPSSLAYIIYTSGSTGFPKGVLIEHGGLSNLVIAQSQAFGLSPGRQVLQFASFSFDAAISEMGMALTTGATLHMADRDTLMSLDGLSQMLKAKRIEVATLPPSLLALLDPREVTSLRTVISAGEACPWETALRWCVGREMFNAYGPTECTVGPTYWQVVDRIDGTSSVPIGRPISNMKVYVLDERRRLVPVGVPGEMCISGIGVARGYLDRPELTSERFIASPFESGTRIYCTGDLARFLPDGIIEYLGRIDQQVKIRGYRIELGEIEAQLVGHPQVRDAVVVARTEGGATTLAAYMIANGEPPDMTELRRFLSMKLPTFMMPAAFIWLPVFPVTPNGKVDRRALPAAEMRPVPETGSMAVPRNELEGSLLEIWGAILGHAPADIMQDFFDLGGHSLLAMRILTQVHDIYGVDISLGAFMQAPTIPALASAIEQLLVEQIRRMDSEEVQEALARDEGQRVILQ